MTLDLLQLTRLWQSLPTIREWIRSLSGLEAAINLTNALLLGAQVTNLAPLASLPRLQSLSLANNGLTSIPGLDILTNLASLDLGDNPPCDSGFPLQPRLVAQPAPVQLPPPRT